MKSSPISTPLNHLKSLEQQGPTWFFSTQTQHIDIVEVLFAVNFYTPTLSMNISQVVFEKNDPNRCAERSSQSAFQTRFYEASTSPVS